ncbi:DUF4279 domain-containing protein [Emcibacter sp.]|uniref:DUF4279 domain-containing protein n=1 Tax=Emcibacter sp. TaxID=1979954 RepID=UPI002AA90703|nr:DUF4279 domain-containing protein [Emcibacter sp.]
MNDYEFCVSLRLSHPSRSLKDFTDLLGLTPARLWTAGEPKLTPKGTALPITAEDSFWEARLSGSGKRSSSEISLEVWLKQAVSDLAPHREKFAEIAQTGGRVELFIRWAGDYNMGAVFAPELLRDLADLHLTLSLDVYPEGE